MIIGNRLGVLLIGSPYHFIYCILVSIKYYIIYIITLNTTLLMYNLLIFYQYIDATCFDHNVGHHQALNVHISSNQTHWLQYGSVFVNGLLYREYIMGIQNYYYD
jgi:hypothetical protein